MTTRSRGGESTNSESALLETAVSSDPASPSVSDRELELWRGGPNEASSAHGMREGGGVTVYENLVVLGPTIHSSKESDQPSLHPK